MICSRKLKLEATLTDKRQDKKIKEQEMEINNLHMEIEKMQSVISQMNDIKKYFGQ